MTTVTFLAKKAKSTEFSGTNNADFPVIPVFNLSVSRKNTPWRGCPNRASSRCFSVLGCCCKVFSLDCLAVSRVRLSAATSAFRFEAQAGNHVLGAAKRHQAVCGWWQEQPLEGGGSWSTPSTWCFGLGHLPSPLWAEFPHLCCGDDHMCGPTPFLGSFLKKS